MNLLFKFFTVTPMDRIAGAQRYFGKGMTTEKIGLVIVVVVIIVTLIIYGIINSRK